MTTKKRRRDPVLMRALKLAGGQPRVARSFNISREAVQQWERCPADRVQGLAALTGNEVTPQELRPDIFREPLQQAS